MKKKLILLTLLALLLCFKIALSQHKVNLQAQQLAQGMLNDLQDSWATGGSPELGGDHPPEFTVWVKSKPVDKGSYTISVGLGLTDRVVIGQLYNVAAMELATTTITPQNADRYQYRIFEGDSTVILPWTTATVFKHNKTTGYAYLGKYNCLRKTIRLEIAPKNNLSAKSVYYYNSDNMQAVWVNMIFKKYQNGSLTAISKPEWQKGFTVDPASKMEQINIQTVSMTKMEMYHLYLRRQFEGRQIEQLIGNNWEHTSMDDGVIRINSSYFDKPGKYTIIIRPEITTGGNKTIVVGKEFQAFFTVPEGPFSVPLKTVAYIILIILTTGGFMFMMYRRDQQTKLARQAKDKQIATLQLASVRAQLNPHFIFNALAGIQNLMNKNEVENANKYLSRFARLTRNILDDGDKELTSIEHEVSLLTDYLQMEQTRFGFNFSIEVDANEIDQQVEIPAMLLQPFVENAVKHGVSALKDKGMITIGIVKQGSSILLTVKDNGKGFTGDPSTGMGLKLCKERIALLNSIYKNTSILLQQTSGNEGTVITVELRNWV